MRFCLLVLAIASLAVGNAAAQVNEGVVSRFGAQNRLRAEGEATSAGDAGDPRGEMSASNRLSREFEISNDLFESMLGDPRLGNAFDPAKAKGLRIFGVSRQDPAGLFTSPSPAPAGRDRTRQFRRSPSAQYLNRLDPSMLPTISDPKSQLEVLSRVRDSIRLLKEDGIRVSHEEGSIVLRGIVSSDYRRRMIERFVLLEPGVKAVRNEIESNRGLPSPDLNEH